MTASWGVCCIAARGGGSATLENQTCAWRRLALWLGMQGSSARTGIGSQANAQNAHPSPPVGIHLPAQPCQAEGIALQAAGEHGDGDHQQQPIEPLWAAEATVCQLEDTGFLATKPGLPAKKCDNF